MFYVLPDEQLGRHLACGSLLLQSSHFSLLKQFYSRTIT